MVKIRDIKTSELVQLEDFLYDAIFLPEGVKKPDKEIINLPELARYINYFGQKSDYCLVAELHGNLVGAIWIRIFDKSEKGFGYIDYETPELSMSVKENFRNQGIGTKMIITMLNSLSIMGYKRVSLSVNKVNYAYRLYQKFGFIDYKNDKDSVTMIKYL